MAGVMVQEIVCQPSKHKALSSNPRTGKDISFSAALKIKKISQVPRAHACNPSYWEAEIWRIEA
jgi:hypothetical protein